MVLDHNPYGYLNGYPVPRSDGWSESYKLRSSEPLGIVRHAKCPGRHHR